jgi:hypothetical protein
VKVVEGDLAAGLGLNKDDGKEDVTGLPAPSERNNLRHGFIAYGKAKPDLFKMSSEELTEEMERLAEKSVRYSLTLHMWGFPYGVDDDLVVVYESERGLENYMNFEIESELPYSNTRTTIVAIPS